MQLQLLIVACTKLVCVLFNIHVCYVSILKFQIVPYDDTRVILVARTYFLLYLTVITPLFPRLLWIFWNGQNIIWSFEPDRTWLKIYGYVLSIERILLTYRVHAFKICHNLF